MVKMEKHFLSTQSYKGTRDFYPPEKRLQKWMFNTLRKVVETYSYQEYDGPLLEPFELYAAKSGQEIVNNQLYWLMDRGERKMAIRPEMTPTMARMVAGKIQELPKPIRWYSLPNLWRYERPQRGRLREHWQLNVDVLGGEPLFADAEVLELMFALIKAFGGEKQISIRINHRKLIDHFFSERLRLKPETALELCKAVDARTKIGEDKYNAWIVELGLEASAQEATEKFFSSSFEEIEKEFPCPGTQELKALFSFLKGGDVYPALVFDPKIMRGMNYYTSTVFEVYDTSPQNPRAMFGGGRYDDLVGLFGAAKLPGVGFGMGDVTLQNFLEVHGLLPLPESFVDVFVTIPDQALRENANQILKILRAEGWRCMSPLEESGFSQQLKMASRHGARYAVLLGEKELAQNQVLVKNLSTGDQEEVDLGRLVVYLKEKL